MPGPFAAICPGGPLQLSFRCLEELQSRRHHHQNIFIPNFRRCRANLVLCLSCSEIPSKLSCLDRILQESLLLKKLPVPRKATNPSISSSLIVFMQTALTPGYFSTVGNECKKEGGAGQSPPKTCCIGEKGGSGIIPLLLQMRKLRPSVLSDWSRVLYQ